MKVHLIIVLIGVFILGFSNVIQPVHATHNPNLFVSAENSQFQNYFGGPMIIEVVVSDPDIISTTQALGEPDVTINGNKLRMIQATDGNWYGYFADRDQAQMADAIAAAAGLATSAREGLDFGSFCSSTSGQTYLGISVTQTSGVAIPVSRPGTATNFYPDADGNIAGGTITNGCSTNAAGLTGAVNGTHVVREAKQVNSGTASTRLGTVPNGQIGLNSTALGTTTDFQSYWPFIQLYQFSWGGNVVVQYSKGGGIQKTILTFDTIPSNMIGLTLDRNNYPQNTQIHTTMTDPQLNIDPTDEDSWTFGTIPTNRTIFYQLFDENGAKDSDGLISNAMTGNLTGLMFEKNGLVKLDKDAQTSGTDVILIQDNTDSVIGGSGDVDTATTSTVGNGDQPVTFTEQSPNSGIFRTYDESDISVLKTASNAIRGTSASIDYNDQAKSILVAFNFGTIYFDESTLGGEWNSGEKVAVTLTDQDQNLNSKIDEDLDVFNADVIMPAIKIGAPLTLSGATIPVISASGATGGVVITTDAFSERAKLTTTEKTAAPGQFFYVNVTTAYTHDTLSNFVRNASSVNGGAGNGIFNYFQYDVRSIGTALGSATISNIAIGNGTTKQFSINGTTSTDFTSSDFQNTINLGESGNNAGAFTLDSRIGGTGLVTISFKITPGDGTLEAGTYPITADFIRFGINNDGSAATDRFNDAIYRLELEETGDNTATFAGSVEYIMLNQINVNQTSTYTSISTIDDEVVMVVGEDLINENSVRANFADLGADGVTTQIADQVEAPTHSGVVSFDASNYNLADTVTVTLQDQDLNTDTDLIDIYITVTTDDYAADTIGKVGYGLNSQGDPRGRLLDITFDDQRWLNSTKKGTGAIRCTDAATAAGGLSDSGFALIETGTATGVFVGNFVLPSVYCDRGITGVTSTTLGTDIEVNYIDFRDAAGEIVQVGDGAGIPPTINAPPVANDDSIDAYNNIATFIPTSVLLANDNDPENGNLSVISIQNVINGTALHTGPIITFTPNANFVKGSFNYTIQDPVGNKDIAIVSLVNNNLNFITKWGSYGSGDGQFFAPFDVVVDQSGNVYAADTMNHRIQKFDSNGNFITKWGSEGSNDGQFKYTQGIDTDKSGNVYVTDLWNARIQKFDSNGNFITKWGSYGSGDGQFFRPNGIVVDSLNNMYVTDVAGNRIQKFDSNGNFITKWGSYGSGDGQFNSPYAVTLDKNGNVYVADTENNRIQKFDSNGNFITKWGSAGSDNGQFSSPTGISFDSKGNIYVVEYSVNRIQKFDSNGNFITKWGSTGNADGQFGVPSGIAIGPQDDIFVIESGNARIQKFSILVADNQLYCGKTVDQFDSVIDGNDSNNVIVGTSGDDLIDGRGGDDRIWGKGGDDCIFGGAGNDYLIGGAGNDEINGEHGNDKIWGQSGFDVLFGGFGIDRLIGGIDNDSIFGDTDNDFLWGQAGDDTLNGGTQIDVCVGGAGTNTIVACE